GCEVAAKRHRPGPGDERDRRWEGDTRLKRVRELGERRRPGSVSLPHCVLASPARPREGGVPAGNRRSQREDGNVRQRPDDKPAQQCAARDKDDECAGVEAASFDRDSTSEAGGRPGRAQLATGEAEQEEADPGREANSKQEAGHWPPPPTRKARASLTGYGAEVSVVRVGRSPLLATGPVAA